MSAVEERKEKEAELHDRLRGTQKDCSYFTSNKKFYSIIKANRDFVDQWLTKRCRGKTVLDYGCGNGDVALWLADRGAYVFGIDLSPVSIQNATDKAFRKGLGEKAVFHVMDAEATEYADGFFDLVVANGVFHHLHLRRAYTELARILKEDGTVIATEGLRHNPFIHLYRKMTPHLRTAWEVEHILGKKQIEMARDYFEKVEILSFFHLSTLGAVPFRCTSFFEFLRRTLQAADSVLLKLPILKWQAWMVVFTLSRPRK